MKKPNVNKIFIQNTFYLNSPQADDIKRAFLAIPRSGRLCVTCAVKNIGDTVTVLEDTGFFGIKLYLTSHMHKIARLSALKGKEGACFDTGRTAVYRGNAAAVLDDDNHFIMEKTSVCEKTAVLYTLSVYSDYLFVSKPDKKLYNRLPTDPKPFRCDNFAETAEKLAQKLRQNEQKHGELVPVIYPGPFRIIILCDGSVLRRGEICLLPSNQADLLLSSKECVVPDNKNLSTKSFHAAKNFLVSYQDYGPLCLTNKWRREEITFQENEIDIGMLNDINTTTQRRIKHLVERRENYFILTGSDPEVEYSCCPSDDVGSANRLVEAGVLQSCSWPSPPGTCPSTIYSFSGEMKNKEGVPVFSINEVLRKEVYRFLDFRGKINFRFLKKIIRMLLLLLVGLSVGLSVFQWQKNMKTGVENNKNTGHVVPIENGVVIYFFHTSVRCKPCLNMESFTNRALDEYFSEEMDDKKIHFFQIPIEDPRYRNIVDHYSIYTSTLVLSKIYYGEEYNSKILTGEVWELYAHEEKFIAMLKRELSLFISNNNE